MKSFSLLESDQSGINGLLEKYVKRVPMPKKIAKAQNLFLTKGEYELYEFLDVCVFYEVDPEFEKVAQGGWYRTMGVRAIHDRVEFFFDAEFLEKTLNTYEKIMFLIAHEASHIFRLHQDLAISHKINNSRQWNVAADIAINYDILNRTETIAGLKPAKLENSCYMEQTDFLKDVHKKEGDKSIHALRIYEYLNRTNKDKKKDNKVKFYKVGDVVKIDKGPDKGKYAEIIESDEGTKKVKVRVIGTLEDLRNEKGF